MLVLSNSARRMRLRLCTTVQDRVCLKTPNTFLLQLQNRADFPLNAEHSVFPERVLTAEHKIQRARLDLSNSSHLIDLNLLIITPWSLNPPIPTSKPTNLHPLNVDPTPPPGSLFCSEGLSKGLLHRNQLCLREGRFKFSRVCLRNKWAGIDILMFHFDLTLKQLKIHF